jgi:hypothetical protein
MPDYQREIISLANDVIAVKDQRIEEFGEALQKIADWSDAYPTDVFPDQDLPKIAGVLAANGFSMGALHGHWGRHLLKGVGKIAKSALGVQETKV